MSIGDPKHWHVPIYPTAPYPSDPWRYYFPMPGLTIDAGTLVRVLRLETELELLRQRVRTLEEGRAA